MALRTLWQRMTLIDRSVVAVLLAGTVLSFFLLRPAGRGTTLVVEQGGRIVFTAPLSSDRTVAIPGPLGETVLAIRGGRARITASACPRKVCMGMGEVDRAGEMLACVPNGVVVHIEGEGTKEGDYDLLSR